MKYLLDTDICVYFLNRNKTIVDKIALLSIDDLAISSFNLTELLFGAYNSGHIKKNLERVYFFENMVEVLPFDRKAVENYAVIKSELKKQGKIIEDFDILIASVAVSNGITLVTNNVKHYKRIPNLKIENWV